MSPHCFIIGATGYTGRAVVQRLNALDIKTTAHVRPNSPAKARWTKTFAEWNAHLDHTPWEMDALCKRFDGSDITHVFSLLGTTAKRSKHERKQGVAVTGYDGVDYGLTMLAFRALEQCIPSARFIYLSSYGVNETAGNAYLNARWRVEQALGCSEVKHTIARPSFISGPDRDEFRPLERIGSVASDLVFNGLAAVGIGGPKAALGTVSNHELAAVLVHHALHPQADQQLLSSRDIAGSIATLELND